MRWWLTALAWAAACARELEPATCARRFDVQPDKIIRTEESQEMGARYLSELDVGARDECLRLCCETDQCDVFVYEEKNPGNCYLFACGPPEDFRCKFTAHGNFSSGVLALSRRLAELQDVERLHHHDMGPPPPPPPPPRKPMTAAPVAAHAPSTVPPAAPAAPAAHAQPPTPTSRRCSRYQFECRSGGECVAVYNACDGVAQCADGSDEAPELGCPGPAAAPPAPAPAPRTPPPPRPAPHTLDYTLLKEPSEGLIDGPGVAPGAGAGAGGMRWPHRLVQAQPAYPESGPSSHIFSHKGGLVQDTDGAMGAGGLGQFAPFEPAGAGLGAGGWPRRPWTRDGLGLESSSGAGGGGGRWGGGPSAGEFPRYEWAAPPDPRRAWPVPPPAPARDARPPVSQEVYAPKTMPETAGAYGERRDGADRPHDQPKKGFDLVGADPPPPPARTAPPPPPPAAQPALPGAPAPVSAPSSDGQPPQQAIQRKVSAAASAGASAGAGAGAGALVDSHDGLSESPPAAVLLLVLGVCMTSALGVVVGCRVRAGRRRPRRRRPLAHDADYLVNGMYL